MLIKWFACLMICAAWLIATVARAAAESPSSNRAPLQSQPYQRLPMGSVQARSWLKQQLLLQKEGLTGHAEQLYDDIGKSDWVTGENRGGQFAWERGPYYAKGLIALAYVLDDPDLKAKAKRWIDGPINSQRENGDFGPQEHNWWANMIVLHYMRDYYEATGDERVLEFLRSYFQFQLKTLPSHTLRNDSRWAMARGGDNLEIVLWLYNKTGEPWLLELAALLVKQTNAWHTYYATGKGHNAYPEHIVNLMQGLKTPPLMYLVSGDTEHKNGYGAAVAEDGWLWRQCGRVDGMVSGTEPITDRSTTAGTELCAIVERILSSSVAIKVLGDAAIGDQVERVAYNALPASLAYDGKGLRYYILPNQPKCTNEQLGFLHNGTKEHSICPSPHSGFGCCRSNFHFGWPKFVHNMWMATADNGLAIAAYGPNRVTAQVGGEGDVVEIDQDTNYPFQPHITLTVAANKPVRFPLELRIPEWCAEPSVNVNSEPVSGVKPGTFIRIERTWQDGDKVEIRFPMPLETSYWLNNSVAVTRGPLVYSLLIEKEWANTANFLNGEFHTREIRPASPWDYALLLDERGKIAADVSLSDAMPTQPFKAQDAPVKLTVPAFRTGQGNWGRTGPISPRGLWNRPPARFPGRATSKPLRSCRTVRRRFASRISPGQRISVRRVSLR
jgi:hypothetical protein